MPLTRRDFMAGAAGAAATASLMSAGRAREAQAPGTAERPNIVMMESDDHLWYALGAMGVDPTVITPNIDRLAARGVLFRNNVCQGAECVPSRHSLLTAAYPHNNGVYSNRCGAIDERHFTMPAAMQRAGYRTALLGKNHFRPRPNENVQNPRDVADPGLIQGWQTYGFDDVRSCQGKVSAGLRWKTGPYERYLERKGLLEVHHGDYTQNRYEGRKGKFGYVGPSPLDEEDTHDAFIRRQFTGWLEEYRDDRPFFAWIDFVAPHLPCDAPKKYVDMYDPAKMRDPIPLNLDELTGVTRARARKRMEMMTPEVLRPMRAAYYAMVTLLDAQVGRIVEALEKKGVLDDTVLVFVGDQGNQLGDHGLIGKGNLLKGSINSPLVISSPARFQQKVVVDRPVEMQDLAPTFLDLAGADNEDKRECYGESLMPLLTGEGDYTREAAFAEKLSSKMVTTGDYKYIYDPNWERQMLFDVRKDPDETNNLSGNPKHADAEAEMQGRLLDWLSATYAHPNSRRLYLD